MYHATKDLPKPHDPAAAHRVAAAEAEAVDVAEREAAGKKLRATGRRRVDHLRAVHR